MNSLTRYGLLAALLLLTACSSLYHPREGWVPEGYADEAISETEYRITFQTYQKEPWAVLRQNLLYRAAEIGKSKGFRYFSLSDVRKGEKVKIEGSQEGTRNTIQPAIGTGADSSGQSQFGPGAQITREWTIRTLEAHVQYSGESGDHQVGEVLAEGPNEG